MSELVKPVKIHLLQTCLAREGEHHAVATLDVFKTLRDDERCEFCADVLRRMDRYVPISERGAEE